MLKLQALIFLLLFSILSCSNLQKLAYSNPIASPCPNFGFVDGASIPPKAIFQHPVDKQKHVVFKNSKDEVMEVPLKNMTSATSIATKEEMISYIQDYIGACGEDSFPSAFKEIDFVKKFIQKEDGEFALAESKEVKAISADASLANVKDDKQHIPFQRAALEGKLNLFKKALEIEPNTSAENRKSALELAKQGKESPNYYPVGILFSKELSQNIEIAKKWSNQFDLKNRHQEIIDLLSADGKMANRDVDPPAEKPIKISKSQCKTDLEHSSGPEDGRFNFGIEETSLSFGYPLPVSSSHFIVRVGKNYASNFSGYNCTAIPLTGELLQGSESAGSSKSFKFFFDGVEIVQLITPMNSKEGSESSAVNQYNVKYTLKNNSNSAKNVSFYYLADITIGLEDSPAPMIDGTLHKTEVAFKKSSVPKELEFRSRKKNSSLPPTYLSFPDVKPESVFIGDWSYLVKTLNRVYTNKNKVTDTAVMMRWLKKDLSPNESKSFQFNYGLKNISQKTSIIFSKPNSPEEFEVHYKPGGFLLSKKKKKLIQSFINNYNSNAIAGILVEGYADVLGNDEYNSKLAQKRVAIVKEVLVEMGIHPSHVLTKSWGKKFSHHSNADLRRGNVEDRKVLIKIFKNN